MSVKIYYLCDPITKDIRYVGKTTMSLIKRLNSHFHSLNKKSHKSSWIKSLLKLGIKHEIHLIDEVGEDMWQFWEIHYISLFRSWGFNLTNKTTGGEGIPKNYKFSQETRDRMSASHKDKKFSEEHKKNIRESNIGNANFKGHSHSSESKEKIKNNNLGKNKGKIPWNKGKKGIYSKESLEKMSTSRIGKDPWNKGKVKKVILCDPDRI